MRSRLPLDGDPRPPRTRIERILAESDGVASWVTLRSRGVDEAELDVDAFYGRVQSISRGWWAMVGAHPAVLSARLAGGRLACRSAIDHHLGRGTHEHVVHVEVPRTASRLVRDPGIVRHWVGDPIGAVRDRGESENVVPLDVASRQWRRCGGQAAPR